MDERYFRKAEWNSELHEQWFWKTHEYFCKQLWFIIIQEYPGVQLEILKT